MIDEDAFGILFSYCAVEDDEYASDERSEFVERFQAFERGVVQIAGEMPLPAEHHIVCLGHAVYIEFRDNDDRPELLQQLRRASARLSALGFANVTALAHGSRWVPPGCEPELTLSQGAPRIVRVSRPCEPLRRVLEVDALARSGDDVTGWGPGVYVDTEALEALGKAPKNAPTVLAAPSGRFYRIPALPAEAR